MNGRMDGQTDILHLFYPDFYTLAEAHMESRRGKVCKIILGWAAKKPRPLNCHLKCSLAIQERVIVKSKQ